MSRPESRPPSRLRRSRSAGSVRPSSGLRPCGMVSLRPTSPRLRRRPVAVHMPESGSGAPGAGPRRAGSAARGRRAPFDRPRDCVPAGWSVSAPPPRGCAGRPWLKPRRSRAPRSPRGGPDEPRQPAGGAQRRRGRRGERRPTASGRERRRASGCGEKPPLYFPTSCGEELGAVRPGNVRESSSSPPERCSSGYRSRAGAAGRLPFLRFAPSLHRPAGRSPLSALPHYEQAGNSLRELSRVLLGRCVQKSPESSDWRIA